MKDIFHLLEADFNPLELCSRLAPLLETLPGLGSELSSSAPVAKADLALYRPALQRVAITKMLHQLSQVGRCLSATRHCQRGGMPGCCHVMRCTWQQSRPASPVPIGFLFTNASEQGSLLQAG